MKPHRIESPQGMIDQVADHREGAVVRAVRKEARSEDLAHMGPGADERIADDDDLVVPDELVSQGNPPDGKRGEQQHRSDANIGSGRSAALFHGSILRAGGSRTRRLHISGGAESTSDAHRPHRVGFPAERVGCRHDTGSCGVRGSHLLLADLGRRCWPPGRPARRSVPPRRGGEPCVWPPALRQIFTPRE